ncbi:MAG: ATP-binding protein [Acidobacteriota bacterium]|nr:ATP-binding protein [Acidobacteriota bacterium]
MYRRNIEDYLRAALADTPVVLLQGARQTGKTTLAKELVRSLGGSYRTLDDAATYASATQAPKEFIARPEGLVVLDEIQKAPDLLSAIKVAVDEDRRPGRFLLTGSARVLTLPTISESLAGRMEVVTLWPLSQGELADREERFIDAIFGDSLPPLPPAPEKADSSFATILQRALIGGFPEAVARQDPRRRNAWFAAYITTILQRDVRDLANIEGLADLPRLLDLLASRSSSLLNRAELSRSTGLAYATLHRYLTLLEMTYLVQLLPPWSANLGKRLSKTPKIDLCDSGLIAHLNGMVPFTPGSTPASLQKRAGSLIESFVAGELRKQRGWNHIPTKLFHYRTASRQEVDLLLEGPGGLVVGIEVKTASSWGRRDLHGLKSLAEALGDRFHRGILLYGGSEVLPCGERIHAVPIRALWEWDGD